MTTGDIGMPERHKRARRSIIRNFSATLAVSLLLVAGGLMIVGYVLSTKNAKTELSAKADEQLTELQEVLKTPLWNYSDREVKIIGDAYVQNQSVAALTILDAHGVALYHHESERGHVLFVREGSVTYQGQIIGTVRFSVSGGYLETLRQNLLWSYFTTVVLFLVVSLALAGMSLRFLLKRSFGNFIDLVEDYANGDETAFTKGAAYIEFAPLVDVLKNMSATVFAHNTAVKQSEARLNAFFNGSPIGMVIYDAEGRHIKINETLTRTSGVSVEDHMGKTMHELLPKDLADRVDAKRRLVMETGLPVMWEISSVLPRASENTQYFMINLFPILGPDAKPVAVGGSVVDISELKNTQKKIQNLNLELEHRVEVRTEELAREKERAENYLKIAATMIVALDDTGNVVLINDQGCAVLGYEKAELIGRNWFDMVIGQEERQMVRHVFAQIMSGDMEPVEEFENAVVTRSGLLRLVAWNNTYIKDRSGKIIGSLSAGQDITEQRANQDKLQDAFELNETIFSNSPVGIVIFDSSGQCILTNQAQADIIGATREQVLAQNYHAIESWKPSGLYQLAQQALDSGEPMRCEVRLLTTFGKDITCDCHLAPLSVYGQTHLLLMMNDVTPLKQVQEQLIQSAKMATLGEMATGVAHELNQPLNVIRMAMNNMQNKADRGVADVEYLTGKISKVVAQVERATAIIDHMRIFGRKPDVETALLDPAAMVKSALGLIGEQLRLSSIEISTDLQDTHRFILGHQVQLEQVLLNLIANARDVLNSKGIDDKRIAIRTGETEDGENLFISVEDNGGGIAPNHLKRVFEPFFTTKEVGKGTGLGLSISYGIITEMGGMLDVRNTDDGACFTITVPAHAADKVA